MAQDSERVIDHDNAQEDIARNVIFTHQIESSDADHKGGNSAGIRDDAEEDVQGEAAELGL